MTQIDADIKADGWEASGWDSPTEFRLAQQVERMRYQPEWARVRIKELAAAFSLASED